MPVRLPNKLRVKLPRREAHRPEVKARSRNQRGPKALSGLPLAVSLHPTEAAGQRTTENAVLSAEDAYGTSVGRDSIGLYRPGWVRGFSPTVAGNARLDGLYFDPIWVPSQRISSGTKVKVGLTVFGLPFPAPTGVIDYQLRRPTNEFAASVLSAYDSFGGALLESDMSIPINAASVNLGIGLAAYRKAFHNGTHALQIQGSAMVRWHPTPQSELVAFMSHSEELMDEIGPVYVPAGPYLPPRIRRRRHIGPDWAVHRGSAANYGVIASLAPSPSQEVRVGVFRSYLNNPINFSNVLSGLDQTGVARHRVTVDPGAKTASTSGEIRWTLRRSSRSVGHALHASIRARARRRNYDGSTTFDLGLIGVDEWQTAPRPTYEFDPTTHERIDQLAGGLAYELRWPRRFEVDASLQYSRYRKVALRPGAEAVAGRSGGILGSAAGAVYLVDELVVYGSYSRGLEEGGIAPITALNRNEAAPALRSEQVEGGLRWDIGPNLRAVAAVFRVGKPYYNIDQANTWRRMGRVRNRGFEFSLAGQVRPNLRLVAGAAIMDPRVLGDEAASGRIGSRPVDVPRTMVLGSVDWQVPGLNGFSLSIGATYTGAVAATSDNRVNLPSRLIIDTGARFRFRLGQLPASARIQVTNVGDVYGFTSRGSGTYGLAPGRQIFFSITVDR